ncbi:MAG TPA: M15 family metallopeptidase [Acidimicrobiales bacterium]
MPRLRLRHLLVTAVLGGLAPVGASAAAVSPIQPGNQPTPIPGATNGALPAADLVNVAPNCQAARAAGPSLGLLLATAREEGVGLGTEICYRSAAAQQSEVQTWTAAGNSACAAPVVQSPSGGAPKDTSMHGWGKAADFFDVGGTVAFGSPGYRFLQAHAGRFGWNHPGWAQPGGSACPEAWHWEWVGDGGVMGATPIRADVVGLMPTADGQGYTTVTGLGATANRGDAVDLGSPASTPIAWLVVGAARTADGGGYWMVSSDGGIFTYGDAHYAGSTGSMRLNSAILGMAPTGDGGGYWLVAADGGIFSFGDAHFWGSTGAMHLNSPIVGMARTATGHGYWLTAADGGVFTFGDARFAGSLGGQSLAEPVVAIAATPAGPGYWLAGADGTVTAFGGAASVGNG